MMGRGGEAGIDMIFFAKFCFFVSVERTDNTHNIKITSCVRDMPVPSPHTKCFQQLLSI